MQWSHRRGHGLLLFVPHRTSVGVFAEDIDDREYPFVSIVGFAAHIH
jgi:hypothetical protein